MILLMFGCVSPPFEPACVTSGDLHTCLEGGARTCNLMDAIGGLQVTLEPAAGADYEASIVADGVDALAFRCVDGEPTGAAPGFVFSCGSEGFLTEVRGDVLEVTVTVDGLAPATTTVQPCWDVSEPNGRCCGFMYDSDVTVAPS